MTAAAAQSNDFVSTWMSVEFMETLTVDTLNESSAKPSPRKNGKNIDNLVSSLVKKLCLSLSDTKLLRA